MRGKEGRPRGPPFASSEVYPRSGSTNRWIETQGRLDWAAQLVIAPLSEPLITPAATKPLPV